VTGRNRGFSLIEVVVVTALIGLAVTLAGPRIGAGMGRLELQQAAQSVRSLIKIGRVQAERTDREHYIVIDPEQDSMTLLNPEMKTIRREELPASVHFVRPFNSTVVSIFIAPSGFARGEPVRLQGRTGDLVVAVQ
jgi:prepilin-type N-terminal cleavage/methylation domain-containing protein